ncbi:MAG: hypothetical protein KIT79_00780 [Deltaproteobacteria bacterium]|nr:hypothetical protein [Deltaproteobacteria bacterium]
MRIAKGALAVVLAIFVGFLPMFVPGLMVCVHADGHVHLELASVPVSPEAGKVTATGMVKCNGAMSTADCTDILLERAEAFSSHVSHDMADRFPAAPVMPRLMVRLTDLPILQDIKGARTESVLPPGNHVLSRTIVILV